MRKIFLSLFLAFATVFVAWADDPLHVKVLSIGNSFSQDAFSYAPYLIEDLAPGTKVDFGILYIGGCKLERHYNNLVNEKPDYEFYTYTTEAADWSVRKNTTLQQGVNHMDWDIIILQQQSADSRYYDTYQPYLDNLLEYLRQAKPSATTAWLLTQAYGTGHDALEGMSSDEMWARTDAASERVMQETSVKLLIPGGTAIQNARYTVLDRFGKARHLTADGYHLHEGIPALIEALTATQVILAHYGVGVDIQQSTRRVPLEWWQTKHIPGANGQPEEATDEEYVIARRCAQWALDNPWQITVEER